MGPDKQLAVDCPEQHPADTTGARTDEHVKEQQD
jgi:hypothetical protein